MKAPDKIFLGIGPMSGDEPDKRYLYAEWYEEQKPRVQNIAYIRKDALLEWAKEKDLSSVLHHPDRHYILVELIKKIESL